MSGHIQQKKGNWYCVIERGYGEDGKRLTPIWYSVRKELGLSKPAGVMQARALLVQLLADKQAGKVFKPKKAKLKEYLEHWHAHYCSGKELSVSTRAQYLWGTTHAESLGHIELSKITAGQIQELLTDKRREYSASSVRHIHKVFALAFKYAVKWGYINVNPMNDVIKPVRPRPKIEHWTEEDIKKFLSAVAQTPHYPLFRLYLATGARKMELLTLKGGQVDYKKNTITIIDAKTNAGWRTVDVSPVVMETLPKCERDEYLFKSRKGGHLPARSLNHIMDRLIEKAGVPRITPHGLRHSFATIMLSRGANIRGLAEILGHTNPSQLWQTYAHLLPSKQKEAAQMMDDLL